MPETYRKQILIEHLDQSKIVVTFPQTEFGVEKVIKKKIKYKYMLYKMNQYFPKSYDISNYSTKADLKGATGVDTSNLAAKSYLASLKHEVDRINIDKLKNIPADLSKLSNKTMCDKLVTKVNAIDFKVSSTSGFVSKTQCNSDKQVLEKNFEDVHEKTPNTSELVEKTNLNCKVIEIENKIPSITG